MVADKKKTNSALAKLTPNAIKANVDGQDIIVATSKDENDVLNMVLAAQMRNMVQEQVKRYKEQGSLMTPKELKELTEAAKNVASFSSEIYTGAAPIADNKPLPVKEEAGTSLDSISFDAVTKPNNSNEQK